MTRFRPHSHRDSGFALNEVLGGVPPKEITMKQEYEFEVRHPIERIVSLPQDGCYADDGSPIKCPECGHAEFTEKMRDFIDFGVGAGPATEIEYFCGSCGESVAYWAYGGFDPAYFDHKQVNTR